MLMFSSFAASLTLALSHILPATYSKKSNSSNVRSVIGTVTAHPDHASFHRTVRAMSKEQMLD